MHLRMLISMPIQGLCTFVHQVMRPEHRRRHSRSGKQGCGLCRSLDPLRAEAASWRHYCPSNPSVPFADVECPHGSSESVVGKSTRLLAEVGTVLGSIWSHSGRARTARVSRSEGNGSAPSCPVTDSSKAAWGTEEINRE